MYDCKIHKDCPFRASFGHVHGRPDLTIRATCFTHYGTVLEKAKDHRKWKICRKGQLDVSYNLVSSTHSLELKPRDSKMTAAKYGRQDIEYETAWRKIKKEDDLPVKTEVKSYELMIPFLKNWNQ